jgi:hypothetical protein
VRILALLTLLIVLASVSVVTASAAGQDDSSRATPAFGEDVPRLLPMTSVEPAGSATPVSRSGIDELALIGAAYWLLLGGVALRRVARPAQLAVR